MKNTCDYKQQKPQNSEKHIHLITWLRSARTTGRSGTPSTSASRVSLCAFLIFSLFLFLFLLLSLFFFFLFLFLFLFLFFLYFLLLLDDVVSRVRQNFFFGRTFFRLRFDWRSRGRDRRSFCESASRSFRFGRSCRSCGNRVPVRRTVTTVSTSVSVGTLARSTSASKRK